MLLLRIILLILTIKLVYCKYHISYNIFITANPNPVYVKNTFVNFKFYDRIFDINQSGFVIKFVSGQTTAELVNDKLYITNPDGTVYFTCHRSKIIQPSFSSEEYNCDGLEYAH